MRTVDAGITAAELAAVRKDRYSIIAQDNLVRFNPFTVQTNALLDTGIPQTYIYSQTSHHIFATWRTYDGKAWASYGFPPSTAAYWALPSAGATQIDGAGAATQYHAMRYGIIDSGGVKVIVPYHNGTGIQLHVLGGSTIGPLFGPAFSDNPTKGCNVEAICPLADAAGTIIVCVGTHSFPQGLSTLQFWAITSSAAVQLDTQIQTPLPNAYEAWYANARYACYVSAIYNSTTGVAWVFANADPLGKAMCFSIQNGIESMLQPVVPVEPVYGSVTFRASSVTQIGDLYYLCGRIAYLYDDGTEDAFDCYLTSEDCAGWSIGA